MANVIGLKENTPIAECLSMSNICTSVLITVLGLSGTRLAKTDDEKLLMVWLLEKDQYCCGGGTVGFDLCELPWNKEKFTKQHKFMLLVLEGARKKLGWDTLDYLPGEEIFSKIDDLEKMLLKLSAEDIDEQAIADWMDVTEDDEPQKQGYPVCQKHNMLLSVFGCYACNALK